jgi:hypothetical protein
LIADSRFASEKIEPLKISSEICRKQKSIDSQYVWILCDFLSDCLGLIVKSGRSRLLSENEMADKTQATPELQNFSRDCLEEAKLPVHQCILPNCDECLLRAQRYMWSQFSVPRAGRVFCVVVKTRQSAAGFHQLLVYYRVAFRHNSGPMSLVTAQSRESVSIHSSSTLYLIRVFRSEAAGGISSETTGTGASAIQGGFLDASLLSGNATDASLPSGTAINASLPSGNATDASLPSIAQTMGLSEQEQFDYLHCAIPERLQAVWTGREWIPSLCCVSEAVEDRWISVV